VNLVFIVEASLLGLMERLTDVFGKLTGLGTTHVTKVKMIGFGPKKTFVWCLKRHGFGGLPASSKTKKFSDVRRDKIATQRVPAGDVGRQQGPNPRRERTYEILLTAPAVKRGQSAQGKERKFWELSEMARENDVQGFVPEKGAPGGLKRLGDLKAVSPRKG